MFGSICYVRLYLSIFAILISFAVHNWYIRNILLYSDIFGHIHNIRLYSLCSLYAVILAMFTIFSNIRNIQLHLRYLGMLNRTRYIEQYSPIRLYCFHWLYSVAARLPIMLAMYWAILVLFGHIRCIQPCCATLWLMILLCIFRCWPRALIPICRSNACKKQYTCWISILIWGQFCYPYVGPMRENKNAHVEHRSSHGVSFVTHMSFQCV